MSCGRNVGSRRCRAYRRREIGGHGALDHHLGRDARASLGRGTAGAVQCPRGDRGSDGPADHPHQRPRRSVAHRAVERVRDPGGHEREHHRRAVRGRRQGRSGDHQARDLWRERHRRHTARRAADKRPRRSAGQGFVQRGGQLLPAEEDGRDLRPLGRRANHLYFRDWRQDERRGLHARQHGQVPAVSQLTDGACSTADANNRWPDHIAERLQAEGHPDVAVVNEAYSGDRVLTNGMGTNALSRFDMSVLSHPRVSTVVMMMGINDIGWPGKDSFTPSDPEPTAEDIIAGYKQIIERAHDHGLRFVGVTLTPFVDTFKGLPTYGYYTPEKEKIREAVNDWIRANKAADGLIDFDKLLEDPNNPKHINPAYNCGDNLHPNDAGYQAMAKSVDLNVLVPKD